MSGMRSNSQKAGLVTISAMLNKLNGMLRVGGTTRAFSVQY
jgi:hypothetical protein